MLKQKEISERFNFEERRTKPLKASHLSHWWLRPNGKDERPKKALG
ncbi:MAG TPA: hypothetical protein PKX18_03345 [Thermosynergistes sp.]|nr:hypothetical protein [Thermosynergistes sp.]HPZ75984.1 hypothetical protein [Thermosynergistes sp.]